jgi:hypothetical protein
MSPSAPDRIGADVRHQHETAGKHPFRRVTDNCYSDYAQVNARQLADLLGAD